MPDKNKIYKIKDALKQASINSNWELADMFHKELDKFEERTSKSILEHASVVQKSDPARAATMLRKALRMDSTNIEIKHRLGTIYLLQKRFREAETILREVITEVPSNGTAVKNFVQCVHLRQNFDPSSNSLYSEDSLAESATLLQNAIKNTPNDPTLWVQLASIFGNNRNTEQKAYSAFEKAIELAPDSPPVLHNFGQFKRLRGDLFGSKDLITKACQLEPTNANYAFSLAITLLFMEELEDTMFWLKQAVEKNPSHNGALVYMAFVLFFQGKFRQGWRQYEKRLNLDEFKGIHFGRPRWEGESLNGEPVLLLREQGVGDNIQFIRYAKLVAEKGAKVIAVVGKELETLFKTVDGVSVVSTGVPEPRFFHRYSPLMSLPHVLKGTKKSIPQNIPYMKAPADIIDKWGAKIKIYPGYRVGIAWRGNEKHANDRFRSSSLTEMAQLLEVKNVSFFSLMKEKPEAEKVLPNNLIELGQDFEDFADTAGAMEALDLIITVDTSICHVAGAIGRPVWTLLAKGNDFRWGLKGKTTPWYPNMTLYRQKHLGNWTDVYKRIIIDLKKIIKNSPL